MLIFDFVNEFSERQEITLDDFPIKITAVSPKGSDKKIFINIYNKKDGVVVEANDFGLSLNSKYHVKYSSR
jgi:hypothetical protein